MFQMRYGINRALYKVKKLNKILELQLTLFEIDRVSLHYLSYKRFRQTIPGIYSPSKENNPRFVNLAKQTQNCANAKSSYDRNLY